MTSRPRIYTNETIVANCHWAETHPFSRDDKPDDDMSSLSSRSYKRTTNVGVVAPLGCNSFPKEIVVPPIDTTPSWLKDDEDEKTDGENDASKNDSPKDIESPHSDLTSDSLGDKKELGTRSLADHAMLERITEEVTVVSPAPRDSTTPAFDDETLSRADRELLGHQKRRVHHRRVPSTMITVGSLVGQSSLVTSPSTVASTTARTETTVTQHYHYRRPLQEYLDKDDYRGRRLPPAVAEIKSWLGRVVGRPMLRKPKPPTLKRSQQGCLT